MILEPPHEEHDVHDVLHDKLGQAGERGLGSGRQGEGDVGEVRRVRGRAHMGEVGGSGAGEIKAEVQKLRLRQSGLH